jgi:hypothetical protein
MEMNAMAIPTTRGNRAAPDPSSRLLSVGELARRSGVAVSALHFYEARGLIRSTRTVGNQRCYARDALRRVGVIKAAQRVGIPLESIRDALPSICCSSTGCMSGGRRRALLPRGEGADERRAHRTGECASPAAWAVFWNVRRLSIRGGAVRRLG